jgi:hypothetical protein
MLFEEDQARSNPRQLISASRRPMRNGAQNRALELAKFGQPLTKQALQQTGDFLGAPVFRFQPHLSLGCKINGRKFALHNDLR